MNSWALDEWQLMAWAANQPERLAPMRVLVIEDDLWLQPVVTGVVLSVDSRIKIDWCTNADQILADLDGNWRALLKYDLVVADIFLPGSTSGLDLWKSCRLACPNVQFLMMSGLSPEQFHAEMAGQRKCPPFLAKPFDVAECRRLVEKLLQY